MKVPRIYYGALVLFCAMTLFVGMASAADTTQPAVTGMSGHGHWQGSSMHHKPDLTNTTVQQQMLTRFQQQGIDTTDLQAAFQAGNMTAAREWMHSHTTHPAFAGNGTGHRGFDLSNTTVQQQVLTRFQQKGVDTTDLQAAFQAGNMTAAREWMHSHTTHPAFAGSGTGHRGFDLTNTTVQQQIVTRLQQSGADVSGLQAAFQSGNTTAAQQWLASYWHAHMNVTHFRHPGDDGNSP
jgi:hypothetical protein